MQQEGGNIRNINEFPKGEFQKFEDKLAALLLLKEMNLNLKNGLVDVHRDTIYTNIIKDYKKADKEDQEALLKSLEGKSLKEIHEIYFNPVNSKEARSIAS